MYVYLCVSESMGRKNGGERGGGERGRHLTEKDRERERVNKRCSKHYGERNHDEDSSVQFTHLIRVQQHKNFTNPLTKTKKKT